MCTKMFTYFKYEIIHQIQGHQTSTECFEPSLEWDLYPAIIQQHKHFKFRIDNKN